MGHATVHCDQQAVEVGGIEGLGDVGVEAGGGAAFPVGVLAETGHGDQAGVAVGLRGGDADGDVEHPTNQRADWANVHRWSSSHPAAAGPSSSLDQLACVPAPRTE